MGKFFLLCCFLGTAMLTAACDSEDASGKTTALPTPEFLVSENVTPESFDLRWESVDHAVSYIYQITDYSTDTKPMLSKNTTTPQASVTGLKPETQYSVSVKAIGDGRTWGDSKWCSTVAETSSLPIPDFKFEVTKPMPDSFHVTVYPAASNMEYFMGWMEQTEWADYLASDGTLDIGALHETVRSRLEKEAEDLGESYLKHLRINTFQGTWEFEVSPLTPGASYVVYTFGCDRQKGTFFDNVYSIVVTTPYRLPN